MKTMVKGHLPKWVSSLSIIVIYAMIKGCIPIEDKIDPVIVISAEDGAIELTSEYYYDDSVKFKVLYTDNDALDSVVVSVSKIITTEGNDWHFIDTLNLIGSRRFEKSYSIYLPKFVSVGDYQILFECYDQGQNLISIDQNFELRADSTPPTFVGLELNLATYDDGPEADYRGCRSEIVKILGGANDNLLLKRVGVSYSNFVAEGVVTVFSDSTLVLDSIFKNDIKIPSFIDDGEILELTFFAYDTAIDTRETAIDPTRGNLTEQIIRIYVGCDDEPPLVTWAKSLPSVALNPSGNTVEIVSGQKLILQELLISDNRQLDSIKIFYNLENDPLTLVYEQFDINAPTLTLTDSEYLVSIDAEPIDIYQINIFAWDTTGNANEPFVVNLNPIQNKKPTIEVTGVQVNDVNTDFTTVPIPVHAGDIVTIDGKVEDDYILDGIRIDWGLSGSEAVVVDNSGLNVEVININDLIGAGGLAIPVSASPGETYQLIIVAEDFPSPGLTDALSLTFEVQ